MTACSIADRTAAVIELAVNTSVLLTGASGGLGRAIARDLALRGCELTVSGRGGGELDRLAAELGARKVEADLARREDVHALARAAGDVDVLIANAALPGVGMLDTYSDEQIDRLFDVNLLAPIILARELAPAMVERGSGHLVFLSSLSAKFIAPASALYSASKAGLRAFASGLRQDLAGTGVGVSTVLPGPISGAGMWADGGAEPPPIVRERTPDDVAAAVVRAIEQNRGEVAVSDRLGRAGAGVAVAAPGFAAWLNRRVGTRAIAEQVAAAQGAKR